MSRAECAFKCFAVCSSFDTVIIDNLSTTLINSVTWATCFNCVLPGQRVVELHRGLVRVEAEAAGGVETTVMGDVALEESYADF